MTLGDDPLTEAAQQFGHAVAISAPEEDLTYARMDQLVDERVDELRAKGLVHDVPVAILARSQLQTMIDLWALWRCGASVALLNPRWPAAALDEAVELIGAERLGSPTQSLHPSASSRPVEGSALRGTILFSSGSTGAPKAIAHTIAAHLASAAGANRNIPLSSGDRWLLSLPLFHVSGLGIFFRCATAGATIVVPQVNAVLSDEIRRARPTHISLVATQLIRLLDATAEVPSCLRAVLLGGGPLPGAVLASALEIGWPLATSYGLTEMASQVTATAAGAALEELQTAGRLLDGREVTINGHGEILVRGATLFEGYFRGGQVVSATDAEGWFATGDLGHWDDQGRLIVDGRRDNMFISGGENVHPERIERAMLELPGVRQVVVVPVVDRQFGHRPVAFVEARERDEATWRADLADRLPRYEIPDRFYEWPELTSLKPDRRHLQQLAEQLGGTGRAQR